jgi:hypothetical protein
MASLVLINKDWYTSIKGGFDTTDRSLFTIVTAATCTGPVDEMFLVTARWGQEITANGSAPTNPQTDMKMNSLGKVVYYTARLGQITVTGEHLRKSIGTNILSDLLDPFVPTFSSEGLEINRRTRLSIE